MRNVLSRWRCALENRTSNGTPSDTGVGRVQGHVVGDLKISDPGSGRTIIYLDGSMGAAGL